MFGDNGKNDEQIPDHQTGLLSLEGESDSQPQSHSQISEHGFFETPQEDSLDLDSLEIDDEITNVLPPENNLEAADAAANELLGSDDIQDESPAAKDSLAIDSLQEIGLSSLVETNQMDPSTANSLAVILEQNPEYISAVQAFIDENPDTYDQVFNDMAGELLANASVPSEPVEEIREHTVELDPVEEAVMSRVVEAAFEEIQTLSVEQLVRKHTQMELYAGERHEYHQYLKEQVSQEEADKYWEHLQQDPKMIEIQGFNEAISALNQNQESEEAQRIKLFLDIVNENKSR
jgi:hypothetical protein